MRKKWFCSIKQQRLKLVKKLENGYWGHLTNLTNKLEETRLWRWHEKKFQFRLIMLLWLKLALLFMASFNNIVFMLWIRKQEDITYFLSKPIFKQIFLGLQVVEIKELHFSKKLKLSPKLYKRIISSQRELKQFQLLQSLNPHFWLFSQVFFLHHSSLKKGKGHLALKHCISTHLKIRIKTNFQQN